MASEKILIADDEAVICEVLKYYLEKEGYQVIIAADGSEAIEAVYRHKPDLVILDLLMPRLDGIEVCQEIRKKTEIPVLFVTSKDESFHMAQGFGAGADDYIRKPFDPMEVVLRVKAHLRRFRNLYKMNSDGKKANILEIDGLKIDLSNRVVKVNDTAISLTAKEFELLSLLAENPNRFFNSEQLMGHVWNSPESVDQRSLMVHISNLRKKIEPDPSNPVYIVSVRKIGYKFNIPGI